MPFTPRRGREFDHAEAQGILSRIVILCIFPPPSISPPMYSKRISYDDYALSIANLARRRRRSISLPTIASTAAFSSPRPSMIVYINVHRRFVDGFLLKYSHLEEVATIDEIKHPIIREALKVVRSARTQFGDHEHGRYPGRVRARLIGEFYNCVAQGPACVAQKSS